MEKLVLEIILPKIDYIQYVKLHSFPVKIGRGFDNDVIIQDEYVSVHHLEINYGEDQLFIKDLNSENGVYINKKQRIDGETAISPNESVSLGKTKLRILSDDHQITKTKELNINKSFSNRYKIVGAAWCVLVLNCLLTIMINHSVTFRDVEFMKLFNDIPNDVAGFLIWAGFFTFIGRLFKRESAFHKQLLYISIFSIILTLFPYIKEVINFNFSNPILKIFLDYVATLPIVCYFLIVVLRDATKISTKKLKFFIPIIVIVFACIIYFSDHIKTVGFRSSLSYERNLQPKFFKISKSKTLENFSLQSEALFKKTNIDD